MLRAVLATCLQWPDLSQSDALYAAALADCGVEVAGAAWNGPFTPFEDAGAVVLRATWDYHYAPDAYRAWLGQLQQRRITVFNQPGLVTWNLDKAYLLELARRGVAVPRTVVAENDPGAIARAFDELGGERAVVKPAVGASGHAVRLLRRHEIATAFSGPGAGSVIVQEFMPEVQHSGELSCIFFNGIFSHAATRQPASGEYRVNSQYSGTVVPAEPAPRIVAQARSVLAVLPEMPLYARVDGVVRDGSFILMELELNEPALFLQHAPGAAQRFAAATVARLTSPTSPGAEEMPR